MHSSSPQTTQIPKISNNYIPKAQMNNNENYPLAYNTNYNMGINYNNHGHKPKNNSPLDHLNNFYIKKEDLEQQNSINNFDSPSYNYYNPQGENEKKYNLLDFYTSQSQYFNYINPFDYYLQKGNNYYQKNVTNNSNK